MHASGDLHSPAEIPLAGRVISTLLSMLTILVLAVAFTRRIIATKDWTRVPLTRWLTFAIYTDSIIFIICTTILEQALGLNSSSSVCSASILLCLTCYLTTKALIFYFLIEKVYIIRKVRTSRFRSKLYWFNCFGMLVPYCVIIVLNFVYRVTFFDDTGMCIIGMQAKSVMPLIISDAVINFYLTLLFVMPLRNLYTYKNSPNSMLRTIALRSFVGSLGTLTSSVANLTILMVLHGEAAWICLMCCNADNSSIITTSQSSAMHTNAHHSTHNKSSKHDEAFDMYGRSSVGAMGTVTTHIASAKPADDEASEKSDIEMGKIIVEVGQVVEQEKGRERGRESRGTEEEGDAGRSHRSTEDLVERTQWPIPQ